MNKTIPYFELSGNAYEIGLQHGRLAAEHVKRSIATYQKMFKTYGGLTWDEAKRRSLSYVGHIENFDPAMMDEMRGLAEGAGVELQDILALNARSEVVMMQKSDKHEVHIDSDGCTALAALPEVTADHHTWLAQNWDWKSTQLDSIILLRIKQQNGPELLMVTEAGIIGKIGFNSAGIGVCLNALGTVGSPDGVPLHIVLRGILNSVKLSDALEKINKLPNACAANYLIASGCGEAFDVEKAPADFDVLYPERGYITHANHFESMRMDVVDMSRLMAPDSFIRANRSRRLIGRAVERGELDEQFIKGLLCDHAEYPDSICRHEDPLDPPQLRMCTIFSVAMDLTEKRMLLAKGSPCESSYLEYTI